ncbi:carbohydrate kinase family protein [candidate division WOR-3 bacterium]|nr:carbohydrate kinase family protein [candidate division WOR-3 bacterium]
MDKVYLYGMISMSTVYVLNDDFVFPRPNEYAEINKSVSSIGGEAANSAIMLSKLGIKTKLDGNWLSEKNADKIRNILKPFNIDITRLKTRQNYGTEEIVITDKNSRTVFGNYASFHRGEKQWNPPRETDIQNATFVSLDPYFKDESLLAAELCVENQKPYVTLDCKYDDYIAQNAEAVILSHELRDQAYKGKNMRDVFKNYQTYCRGLVIFTFGSDELWYGRKEENINRFKPYKIEPVDTTGAGDSFRSGVIYGLMKSWDDRSTVEFASAVSACVCLTFPHTLNAPGLDGIIKFMENYSEEINKNK